MRRRPNSGTCVITDSRTEVARVSRSRSLFSAEAGKSRAVRHASFSASDFFATLGSVTFFFAVRGRGSARGGTTAAGSGTAACSTTAAAASTTACSTVTSGSASAASSMSTPKSVARPASPDP